MNALGAIFPAGGVVNPLAGQFGLTPGSSHFSSLRDSPGAGQRSEREAAIGGSSGVPGSSAAMAVFSLQLSASESVKAPIRTFESSKMFLHPPLSIPYLRSPLWRKDLLRGCGSEQEFHPMNEVLRWQIR